MGAVGGVAILGGNFEASTFPEDKVVQRSLTAGSLETAPIEAIILDSPDLGAPGQRDSHATVWKGHSNDGSPHSIDWKVFVDVTADDGTGSIWTLQTRIDGAPYTDIMTVDDNGLLTVSGATFTMDQLIVDTDNTEAVLIRKDGDAGDVFIIDTINDVVRMGSDATLLTFGGSSDVILERVSARVLQMNSDPLADSDNELRIVARDDPGVERYIQLLANGTSQARVAALRADGGGRFDLELFTTSGSVEIWTDAVQRWTFGATSGGFDAEILPFITDRYDIGNTTLAVRNLYTNGVLIGQDKVAAYDAITIDGTDLAAPGQQDSGAIILTGLSNDGSPHDIDWKQFVEVTANDGTGSIFTIQARIDGASFVDEFTITATTSPTLAHIGPGSTDGALAFGPIGSEGPASAGTIRFRHTDDIRFRNEGDDGDLIAFAVGESNKLILGEAGILFIDVPTQMFVTGELTVNFSDTAAFRVGNTGLARTVFEVDTTNLDVELLRNVERSAAVLDRFKILGRDLSVNSTVGFSGAILLEGQAREAGGSLHDATWRMYVEPLTTTAFDGQSVFKITAEIDTGGPTTVFTLSDTGDLIVPGSFTIDGLIIDVDSPEAFLVRKNGDGGDVFVIDTDDREVKIFGILLVDRSSDTAFRVADGGGGNVFVVDTDNGGIVTVTGNLGVSGNLEIGATPATSGSIRLSNVDAINIRNAANNANLNIISFNTSNQMDFGDAAMPQIFVKTRADFEDRVLIMTGGPTSTGALLVGGDLNVDTTNNLVTVGTALAIGSTPAASGTIRLPNTGDIRWRNAANNADHILLSVGSSDEMILGESTTGPFIRVVPPMRHFDTVSIPFTSTVALSVSQDSFANNLLTVDTTNGNIEIGNTIALQVATSVDRLIITGPTLTVNSTAAQSHRFLMQGRTRTSGAVQHTSDWRMVVNPLTTTGFDGQSQLEIVGGIDGSLLGVVAIRDNGRFAITQPEQVSIGSPSFIDNVQVNITGSFIDDYGGGPTTTHKFLINGSQTGDTGRTNRQTVFDLSAASIITQNASQTIDEVGGMFIVAPTITPGTDTITKAYTLKVMNTPTLSGTENYGLFVDSAAAATNLTALVRIGRSFNQGIKLLVGGGVGAENIEGTAQMRLTNFYTPDGLQTEAMLLHVHSTLQATDGTTDHITGAFFEGTLRTQVEADENVANISQVRIDEPNIQDNLTGTGEITNAQSLLITGAPTEGESNYALRILGGNLQIANASAFLFRQANDAADLTALSMGASNFLEIGGPGSADFEAVEVYSLGHIVLFPTDDLRVQTDNSIAFRVRTTGSVTLFQVDQTRTRVVSQLVVAASVADHEAETQTQSTFADVATSAGSSVAASGLIPAGSFVIGITVRVLTTVGGPASFDVGDGTDVDRWGAAISSVAGTITTIADFTTSSLTTFPFANDVVITSTGVDFTSGSVRITVHYMTLQTSEP